MKKPHKLQHAVCVVGFYRKSDVAPCAEALRVAGYLVSDRNDLFRCPTDALIEARRPLAPGADEKATMKAIYDEIQRTIKSFRSANMDEVAPLDFRRLGRRDHKLREPYREMALAHVVGDKVEAAYRRGELLEKRKELADVSKYCTSSPAGQTVCEEVVTLRGDGR